MIYLLTAIGLTPVGCSTVHIYTQTVHRTTQWNTKQHWNINQYNETQTTQWNTIVKDSEETKQIISQCNWSYRCTVHLTVPQRKNRGHHKPEFQRQNSTGIQDIPNIFHHTTPAPRTRRTDAFLFFEGLEHIFSNASSLSLVLSSNFDPRQLQYIPSSNAVTNQVSHPLQRAHKTMVSYPVMLYVSNKTISMLSGSL
jgi:hypothetical protein